MWLKSNTSPPGRRPTYCYCYSCPFWQTLHFITLPLMCCGTTAARMWLPDTSSTLHSSAEEGALVAPSGKKQDNHILVVGLLFCRVHQTIFNVQCNVQIHVYHQRKCHRLHSFQNHWQYKEGQYSQFLQSLKSETLKVEGLYNCKLGCGQFHMWFLSLTDSLYFPFVCCGQLDHTVPSHTNVSAC